MPVHAGWEPLLTQIRDDTTYRGDYRRYFRSMARALLERLAVWQGRRDREAMELGKELTDLTLQLSVPPAAAAAFDASGRQQVCRGGAWCGRGVGGGLGCVAPRGCSWSCAAHAAPG